MKSVCWGPRVGDSTTEPGLGPSLFDLEACGFSPSSFRAWVSVAGVGSGMRQPEPVCLVGKIQASVGSSQVRLALWGVEGEKTWVRPQLPCSEGGPLFPRAGSGAGGGGWWVKGQR